MICRCSGLPGWHRQPSNPTRCRLRCPSVLVRRPSTRARTPANAHVIPEPAAGSPRAGGLLQRVDADQAQLVEVDQGAAVDAAIDGPEHDLSGLQVDQPSVLVVGLTCQRRGDLPLGPDCSGRASPTPVDVVAGHSRPLPGTRPSGQRQEQPIPARRGRSGTALPAGRRWSFHTGTPVTADRRPGPTRRQRPPMPSRPSGPPSYAPAGARVPRPGQRPRAAPGRTSWRRCVR